MGDELEHLAAHWADSSEASFKFTLVLTRQDSAPHDTQACATDPTRRRVKRPRYSTLAGPLATIVSGQHIDAVVVREHLFMCGALGESPHGNLVQNDDTPSMTIISGPQGFNEHCQRLVSHAMPRHSSHPIAVLDA